MRSVTCCSALARKWRRKMPSRFIFHAIATPPRAHADYAITILFRRRFHADACCQQRRALLRVSCFCHVAMRLRRCRWAVMRYAADIGTLRDSRRLLRLLRRACSGWAATLGRVTCSTLRRFMQQRERVTPSHIAAAMQRTFFLFSFYAPPRASAPRAVDSAMLICATQKSARHVKIAAPRYAMRALRLMRHQMRSGSVPRVRVQCAVMAGFADMLARHRFI